MCDIILTTPTSECIIVVATILLSPMRDHSQLSPEQGALRLTSIVVPALPYSIVRSLVHYLSHQLVFAYGEPLPSWGCIPGYMSSCGWYLCKANHRFVPRRFEHRQSRKWRVIVCGSASPNQGYSVCCGCDVVNQNLKGRPDPDEVRCLEHPTLSQKEAIT
jgi:hypothetical protein